jgi:hypothetical protein
MNFQSYRRGLTRGTLTAIRDTIPKLQHFMTKLASRFLPNLLPNTIKNCQHLIHFAGRNKPKLLRLPMQTNTSLQIKPELQKSHSNFS